MNLFRTKSVEKLLAEGEAGHHQLKRALSALNLTTLGVGGIIGAGIFVSHRKRRGLVRRARNCLLVYFIRNRMRLRRPLLRRVCLNVAHRRKRLHLCLCHTG